ncbi:nucleoside triphosphate pyrophosphohydrolase [Rhodothermus marinus]|uniref:nucleoside triphosphate pyrophosphohydrolase n=1 Tax=Rhodothermus marinus TaxID=29549 RepID=UPI0012BA3D3D|nr:nucleoside triphosphate pyrophosphohydrolase [Rhodothermus marinus]BBM68930.1 nucleoside triphosphate pyrophosphohydrolase [Rhodothermus marinus]BBM71908.1 nucleoside triphosphate pyrophosphohydrolase [Rhodothermus marinus]
MAEAEKKPYDPSFRESEDRLEAYADFVAIVRQLRRDCPWDREQTHESVKHLLIEEAYEVVSAIEENDWEELKRELGDLLLHVVFHSVMAEQAGRFTLKDVIETETEKLIRRHPHVFGDVQVGSVQEVLSNWEQIKLREKAAARKAQVSALEGVPRHLPALLRAYRIQEKAAGVGFDFPERKQAWQKVEEELQEFHQLTQTGAAPEKLEDELGDVLFALVNYARLLGLNPENALQRTNNKFIRRFRHIEARLAEQGRTPAEADLDEMDRYWEEAKSLDRHKPDS